jgi:hypothetical protein
MTQHRADLFYWSLETLRGSAHDIVRWLSGAAVKSLLGLAKKNLDASTCRRDVQWKNDETYLPVAKYR